MGNETVVTVICAVIGSAAFTELVKAGVGWLRSKAGKKTSVEQHLEDIDAKISALDEKTDKLGEKSDKQYLSLLRLTVMSEEMPISERLVAGQEYIRRGGNGDVKKFIHELDEEFKRGHSHEEG